MALRRNIKRLDDAGRARLIAAFQAVKSAGRYDELVKLHAAHLDDGHGGPAYLPWNRAFLLEMERALQKASGDPDLGLPYWDFAEDAELADPTTSPVWGADLLGGSGAPVQTGPFAAGAWRTGDGEASGGLTRALGGAPGVLLPTRAAIRAALAIKTYDAPPWDGSSEASFRRTLEDLCSVASERSLAPRWIGGQMASAALAPNDPVFWLYQCNVDRIWAEWQRLWPSSPYLPSAGARSGHNVTDRMTPFGGATPLGVLGALPYDYDRFYSITKLVVVVKTSDALFSGTDDPISITLVGPTAGVAFDLDGSHCDHKDPFETGQTDTFTFTEVLDRATKTPVDPESLAYFTIRKGSTTRTGDWKLSRVTIHADNTVLYDNQALDVKLVQSEARFTDDLRKLGG